MQGLGLGITPNMLIMLLSVYFTFFLAMWEEYHTHYARTHMLSWGVTEAQLTVMGLLIIGSIYTAGFYKQIVYGITLEDLLVTVNAGWGFAVSSLMVFNTLSKTSGIQPLLRLIPIIMMNISLYLWFNSPLSQNYAAIILIVHALVFAGICSKVIICSTSIMNFGWFHLEVVIELLFLLEDKYLRILPSEVTFFILCLYLVLNYSIFVTSVVNQLASYLKISIFKVD